jgi:serine protease Do
MDNRRQRQGQALLCIIVLWTMIFLSAGCSVEKRPTPRPAPESNDWIAEGQLQPLTLEKGDNPIAAVAKHVSPAVVGLSTISIQESPDLSTQDRLVEGVGTGVVVHSDGYILTNHHVAGGNTKKITVIFEDGKKMEGTTLWYDRALDLAVVKVEGSGFQAAALGDSSQVRVGETAIAIGTPLGLEFQHTVTSGIISALNRTLRISTDGGETFMEDLIQTDASINPGNSGGPLLNIRGEVIGINTIKVTAAEGIGFAIPIDVAKPIIGHFIKEGKFVTPYIGVFAYDKKVAAFYQDSLDIKEGVYVIEVDRRGPAYEAGVRVGDVITQVDGQTVNTMLDLRKTIYARRVGDRIAIRVERGKETLELAMVLAEKPIE